MGLTDLEIRKYTKPLEKELNNQKEKNGRLKAENTVLRNMLRHVVEIKKVDIVLAEALAAAEKLLAPKETPPLKEEASADELLQSIHTLEKIE